VNFTEDYLEQVAIECFEELGYTQFLDQALLLTKYYKILGGELNGI